MIVELLVRHDVPYQLAGQHHHARPGWVQVDCPWCGPRAGKFHLGINLEHGYANCWRCGYHWLPAVLARVVGGSSREWAGRLSWAGLDYIRQPAAKAGRLRVPVGLGPLLPPHRHYLRSRGFDPDRIERLWQVRGMALGGPCPWSIWIPVHKDGRLVSWTSRSIGSDPGRRYITARSDESLVPLDQLLYGWDYVRTAVVVCEGPLDVWRIGPGAVATFGLSVTEAQMGLLTAVPVRAICFDAEPEARRAARRLADGLSAVPGDTYVVELETGEDPASASDSEIQHIRDQFLSGRIVKEEAL